MRFVVKERNLVEISGIMHLMISHMEACSAQLSSDGNYGNAREGLPS